MYNTNDIDPIKFLRENVCKQILGPIRLLPHAYMPSILTDEQMSPVSSTLDSEQPLVTIDNIGKSEDIAEEAPSEPAMSDDVLHSPHTEKCVPEADKTLFMHSSSPSALSSHTMCQGSNSDMTIAPLFPSPLMENSTKDNVYNSMASSNSTPNSDSTGMAIVPPQPVIGRSEVSRISSPRPSGNAKGPRENIVPVDSSSGVAKSDDPCTALPHFVLGCSPCLATDSALETEISATNDISNNAELIVSLHVTYPAQELLSGPTAITSSPEASKPTTLAPVDKDSLSSTREVLPCDHNQSSACDVKIPGPVSSQISGAPPTLFFPMDALARDTSRSPVVRTSGSFMQLTPPPSSPLTECSVSVAENLARDVETGYSSNLTEINGYPAITASSPNLGFYENEPSSSPSPHHQYTGTKRAQRDESDEDSTCAKPVKRIRMDETMSSPLRNAPTPRRATLASQRLSRKKLAAPFRSPLQIKPTSTQSATPTASEEVLQERILREPPAKYKGVPAMAREAPPEARSNNKSLVLSSRAAAQFRSPLGNASVHASRPIVLPNQAIMNLERKVAILRRAVKIKRDGDEDHLKCLTKKWRDAGREAAYELWSIVRDFSTEGGEIRGNGTNTGWGWDNRDERDTSEGDGLDTEGGESAERQENTLGVMLRKLGIAPETLGWNDEEETFVDDESE